MHLIELINKRLHWRDDEVGELLKQFALVEEFLVEDFNLDFRVYPVVPQLANPVEVV